MYLGKTIQFALNRSTEREKQRHRAFLPKFFVKRKHDAYGNKCYLTLCWILLWIFQYNNYCATHQWAWDSTRWSMKLCSKSSTLAIL